MKPLREKRDKMLDIAFVNETEYDIEHFEELIMRVFQKTMEEEQNDTYYEISVVFVTRERIQDINVEYRKIDKVTDVISFALFDKTEESDIIQDEENITTLGDIFICFDVMREQAKEYGHSEEREMAFLACHGLLHLLGYDHQNKEDEKKMFQKQDLILDALNIKR